MAKKPPRRAVRAAIIAAVALVAALAIRSAARTESLSAGFPSIGSDTWPPVPTNPDRPR
jgi:hypothetical protein